LTAERKIVRYSASLREGYQITIEREI